MTRPCGGSILESGTETKERVPSVGMAVFHVMCDSQCEERSLKYEGYHLRG